MHDETTTWHAHAIALGAVAAATVMAWALGTGPAAAVALFLATVAIAARVGGGPSGAVAMLASIFAIDTILRTSPAVRVGPWTAFAASAALTTWLIAWQRERLEEAGRDLERTYRRLRESQASDRRARLLNAAYERTAIFDDRTAAVALDRRGLITAWTAGATELYRRPDAEALGAGVATLFAEPDAAAALIAEAASRGSARWSGTHRRQDGSSVEVDVEIHRAEAGDAFTLAVRDLTRERQWEAFRASATRSDAALRADVEVMRRQLAALESVTDPTLDATRRDDLEQLLERLRVAVDADGIAFVQAAGIRRRVIGGNGLQPTTAAPRAQAEARRPANRVLVVQNDPARVAQSSVLAWPDTVSCLIAVPITMGGQSRGVLELVNERPRRATDADMALIRVVANRAAGFDGNAYGEAGAVA